MRAIVHFFFFSIVFYSYGQTTNEDSLLWVLDNAGSGLEKFDVLHKLSTKSINSDLFRALEYGDKAISIAKEMDSDSLVITAWLNLGNIYLQFGNYARAMQMYQQVLNTSGENYTDYFHATANGNLGSIHYYQRQLSDGLKYYLKALDFFNAGRALGNKRDALRRAHLLNNAGIIYEESAKYDSALYFYTTALQLAENLKEYEILANILNNLGTLYADQGDYKLAVEYYNRAMAIRESNNNKLGIARSNHNLGTFYFKYKKDYARAENYLRNAITVGTEVGSWQTVSSASGYLHLIYKENGDFRKAYETLELNRQVSDSLFNEESTRKIAQLEMQTEFDRQQSMQQARQKEKDLYYLMAGGGLFFLLVTVSLLFILQRTKNRRIQAEQVNLELEKKNLKNDLVIRDRELATNIMVLLNKNELIDHLSEKLLDIKKQVPAESQPAIQKVVIDLQSNLQPELWREFEYRFQQVHEHFYKILNDRFPGLSPGERRLCAFLKLDMTTKEIAALTHQNAKSIDVARTRLRKKLNLTGTDQNLVSFLSGLGY